MPRRIVLVLAILAASMAACIRGMSGGTSSMSCENMPSGACTEQAEILTAGLSGVSDVSLTCRQAPPCTRAGGAGTAEIRFQNGQKLNRAWSYTGNPNVPVVRCVGLAQPLCMEQVQSMIEDVPPSKAIAAVDVSCTSATCTDASGELKVRITLGDGSVQEVGTGWSSGP